MNLPLSPPVCVRAAISGALISLLAACGGNSSDPAPATAAPDLTAAQTSFRTDYTAGVAALSTFDGLSSTSFVDLFDDGFLDAGYNKSQLRTTMAQEATAITIAPDLSGFPGVVVSNVSVGTCDANNVCAATMTFTNADVDTTAVTVTTQVKVSNGKFRLLGDQRAS